MQSILNGAHFILFFNFVMLMTQQSSILHNFILFTTLLKLNTKTLTIIYMVTKNPKNLKKPFFSPFQKKNQITIKKFQ